MEQNTLNTEYDLINEEEAKLNNQLRNLLAYKQKLQQAEFIIADRKINPIQITKIV